MCTTEQLVDQETGQMVWVLTYDKSSPVQSIRIPLDEALQICCQEIVSQAQIYPELLRMHHAYPQLFAAIQKIGPPTQSA